MVHCLCTEQGHCVVRTEGRPSWSARLAGEKLTAVSEEQLAPVRIWRLQTCPHLLDCVLIEWQLLQGIVIGRGCHRFATFPIPMTSAYQRCWCVLYDSHSDLVICIADVNA